MGTERRRLENQDLRRLITAGQLMALELHRLNKELPIASQSTKPTPGLTEAWERSLATFHAQQEDIMRRLQPQTAPRGKVEGQGGRQR